MAQPIVCNLNAIPSEQRARHQALAHEIFEAVEDQRPLLNGYRFRLPARLWLKAAEWATLERLCCPFIDFRLELLSEGTFWLSLSGEEGVKELLHEEFKGHFAVKKRPFNSGHLGTLKTIKDQGALELALGRSELW